MPFSCHQFKTNGNLFSFLYPKWNSNAPGEYLLPIFLPVCWFWAMSCWILLLLLLFPSPHPSCTVTMENDPEVCIHQDRLWIISGFHQQPIKLWMDPVACTRHRGCAFGYMLKSHQWNPELEAKGHCHPYQTIKAVSQLRGCTQVVEVFINMWLRTASSKLIQAPKERVDLELPLRWLNTCVELAMMVMVTCGSQLELPWISLPLPIIEG